MVDLASENRVLHLEFKQFAEHGATFCCESTAARANIMSFQTVFGGDIVQDIQNVQIIAQGPLLVNSRHTANRFQKK